MEFNQFIRIIHFILIIRHSPVSMVAAGDKHAVK